MTSGRKKTPRLGKGLSSLMAPAVPVEVPTPTPTGSHPKSDPENTPENTAGAPTAGRAGESAPVPPVGEAAEEGADPSEPGIVQLPLDAVVPNPRQPRQHFDESALRGLASSIRAQGIMQPIVVRPRSHQASPEADAPAQSKAAANEAEETSGGGGEKGGYELVAGERRWRAARLAGLTRIPALVRELDDRELTEWALIENLQREDLNPMERAEAFASLAQRFELRHDQVAQRVGLERSTVSNLLRLLNLSEEVRQYVRDGLLSMGQSRALAGVADAGAQRQLAGRVVREGLSVRQVEAAARAAARQGGDGTDEAAKAGDGSTAGGGGGKSPYLADLEKQVAEQLGTRVAIKPARKKGAGTLAIEFYSLDQFDALLEKLGVHAE